MIESALRTGDFISYGRSWDFVRDLEETKRRLDGLLALGDVDRAVGLYEIFLAGCYEKVEELDDSSGNLGMFFRELFCSWIKARQRAGRDPAETVREIVAWVDHDDYGFCYDIEGEIASALDKEGRRVFKKHLEERFDAAFASFVGKEAKIIHEYPAGVRMTARSLKKIYIVRRDVRSYIALSEKTLVSPADCENIAKLYKAKSRPAEALSWVERGLAEADTRRWGNEDSHGLEGLKRELLSKVGRKADALQSAWAAFAEHPSSFMYEELMRYVTRRDRGQWHDKAMAAAEDAALADFMDLCVQTKEIDLLAARVDATAAADMESVSHYFSEKAATALARRHGLSSAKLRCAMAMRIVDAGKSKYYDAALEHLRAARDLYNKHGQDQAWQLIVERIRASHHRKQRFMAGFEEIVAGGDHPAVESFESRARARWRKQTSG